MDSSPSSPIGFLSSAIGHSADKQNVPIGLILAFLALMLCSAYFAGAETSFSSVNRIRMLRYADEGNRRGKRAKRVLYILDHFDSALSTILVGNNIMHIGAASLATLFATRLWGEGSVGLSTVVTTLLLFFFAEMIPKSIAKVCNERFALLICNSLLILMRVLKPVVFVFTKLGDGVKKLFRVNSNGEDPTVTEDEFHDIVDNITHDGAIDEDSAELVQNALEFTETPVRDVFTPWSEVTTLHEGMQPRDIVDTIQGCNHSRLPVLDTEGEVSGMLQIRKYLKAYITRGGHVSLHKVMDKPHFVLLGAPIDEQLAGMSADKTHIAVVRDEQGKTVGILTVEDILEELVGEIYDEDDTGGESA